MQTGAETDQGAQPSLVLRLLDVLPIPVVVIDRELRVLSWNAAAHEEFGWTAAEVLGRRSPIVPPEMQTDWEALVRDVFDGLQLRNVKTYRVRRDGSRVEVLVSTALLRDGDGATSALGLYFIHSDMDPKEARARQAEQRARALLESTGDMPVLIFDERGSVLQCNPAAARMFGRAPSLPGLYANPDDGYADIDRALRTGHTTRECWVVDRSGARHWADVFVTAVRLDHSRELIVFVREAEARRRRESAREELTNFASRALAARTIADLAKAAVDCISISSGAARVEILGLAGNELRILHATDRAARGVLANGDTIYATALASSQPVTRKLTESDFHAAPHLHSEGLVYGTATAVPLNGTRGVLAAFWRDRRAADEELFPLSACATILAIAASRVSTEQQLVDRELQLRLTLDQLPAAVWTTDSNLTITDMRGNVPRAPQGPASFISHNVAEYVETDRPDALEKMRAVLAGDVPFARYTYEWREEIFDVRVDPLRDENGNIDGTVAVAFDITEHQRSKDALRQMAASMNAMQENERRRIARELHDQMGTQLTALRFELDLLRRELGEHAPAERIEAMAALVDSTGDTMRRAIADLRPSVLDDFGFRAAVENELIALRRRSGIEYDLHLPPHEPPLGRDGATALFRIVQEALTNVARHAAATHVTVKVSVLEEDTILLEVSDNGRGITENQARHSSASFGLVGVRERAWAFGGTVTIEGNAGAGTRLLVRLPASSAPA